MLSPEEILAQSGHRPWPLPALPWFMFQQWSNLLFAHWAVDAKVVRALVPEELELDLFQGKAWVGLTPFRMSDLHMRGLPTIPGAGRFLEMNLRTYVRLRLPGVAAAHRAPGRDAGDARDMPGVFFFSLDADNLPAVAGARIGMGLPYFWSEMSAEEKDGEVRYSSVRKQSPAEAQVRYTTTGDHIVAKSELEIFLTERYCLYEVRAGVVMRTEIHHVPWPLQKTRAAFTKNSVGSTHRIPLDLKPDHVHFNKQIDVLVFPPMPAMG